MASVKFYLDTRSQKNDGTYPLKLSVHHKKPFHIPLNVSVEKENWIDNAIHGSVKNKAFLNSYLKSRFSAVENYLLTLKLWGKLDQVEPDQLKKMLLELTPSNNLIPNGVSEEKKKEEILGENYLFKEHADLFIKTRKAPKTRETYEYTMDTLAKFHDLDKLTFGDIDYDFLEYFEIKLWPTSKVNTISIHLRNIRAIFKNATRKKLVSKDLYPFDDYQIKTEETMHRDLSVDDLCMIRDYPVDEFQEKYRDLFMLQFYLIGINTIDILHTEVSDFRSGRLKYRRAKTGKPYDVKLEPEAIEIIKKYSNGEKYMLDFLDTYVNYKDFLNRYNRNLKKIGPWRWVAGKSKNGRGMKRKEFSPLFPFLSSYYARHTWATLASRIDIPESTIKRALGHGKRTVTDIYINYDIKKVDEANRQVIDYVNSHSSTLSITKPFSALEDVELAL